MTHPEPIELIQARKLIEKAKFEEALQVLNSTKKIETLSILDQISLYILKSSIYLRLDKKEEFFKYAKKAFQISQGQKPSLQLLDVYIKMAQVSNWGGLEMDKALEFLDKCEDIFKNLTQEPPIELVKREAQIVLIKS